MDLFNFPLMFVRGREGMNGDEEAALLSSTRLLEMAAGRLLHRASTVGGGPAPHGAAERALAASRAIAGSLSTSGVCSELQVVVDLLEGQRKEAADRVERIPAGGPGAQAAAELAEIEKELEAARRCLRVAWLGADRAAGADRAGVQEFRRESRAALAYAADALLRETAQALDAAPAAADADAGLAEDLRAARGDLVLVQKALQEDAASDTAGQGGEPPGRSGGGGHSPRVVPVPPSPSWTFPGRVRGPAHTHMHNTKAAGPAWVRSGGRSVMQAQLPAHGSPGSKSAGARYVSDSGGRARRNGSGGGAVSSRGDSFYWGAQPSSPVDKRGHTLGMQWALAQGSSMGSSCSSRAPRVGDSLSHVPGWPLVPSAEYIVARMRADAEIALQEMEARLLPGGLRDSSLQSLQLPLALQAHALDTSRSRGRASLFAHSAHAAHAQMPGYLPSPAPSPHFSPPVTAMSRWLSPRASAEDRQCERGEGGEADGFGWDTDAEFAGEEWKQMAAETGGVGADRSHLDLYIDSLGQTIAFWELIDWFHTGAHLVYDSPLTAGGLGGGGGGV
jgi:hypothetical protein